MEKLIVLLALTLLSTGYISGQDISFSYDADGNMESRYTALLRSGEPEETENEPSENVSMKLDHRQITVYPNPTRGELCVEISPLSSEEENILRLFDSSGRLLEVKKINSERTYLSISGNPGVYLLNIHLGDTISKWKIVKQ